MNRSNQYYLVYVLQSDQDGLFYTGYTENLKKRMREHLDGQVLSTKNRLPMKLVYWEGCLNQQDATRREKYLKSTWGKRYLRIRMANYLTG